MWSRLTGRRPTIDQEQEDVTRALAYQRSLTRQLNAELDGTVQELRGSDARMMNFLARMQGEASRAKKGHH